MTNFYDENFYKAWKNSRKSESEKIMADLVNKRWEEFDKRYCSNRPCEPFCSDNEAEMWFEIACYAEDHIKQAFLAGLKAGRQWHYVKDGLPTKNTKVCLLYLGDCLNPTTGWFENNVWHFEGNLNPDIWQDKVIAWQEIALPKESE